MNKYEVLGVVGEGAYGVVLKCRNKENGEIGFPDLFFILLNNPQIIIPFIHKNINKPQIR